ncbi:M14 family metallocarboxypeptidase [Myxococcus sp. MxC21-1]|uniref:M14 family metallopeptidase n=1 Tax=Myxococcus sp. MxC21-1 TaxID=3041439 RepID=UPI0029303CE3|nr:M14 family metallocarboxypeptidase [Myxococcus sp. MxC21-1]WNZ59997.1 M14 family metallocarboxypeptidase [Myxococcus sp. MxC21-1]
MLSAIDRLRARFDVVQYGLLDYPPDTYPLFALASRDWRDGLPVALVTGGVHGYETSGVHGALQFVERHAAGYAGRFNLLVVPCVSPWAYERIHRWNMNAIDPNRSFREPSPAEESAALMRLVAPLRDRVLVHVDLHETTDSDEAEFRPALAARDGKPFEPGHTPTDSTSWATPRTRGSTSSRRSSPRSRRSPTSPRQTPTARSLALPSSPRASSTTHSASSDCALASRAPAT